MHWCDSFCSFQIKSQLNLSTGEFQSLTGQLDDVNCLLVVVDKLVNLQVRPGTSEPCRGNIYVFGFPTRSDTNRAVQPQKMATGSKFLNLEVEGMYYPCSENKGADQLHGYHAADLRLCFHICKKQVFSSCGSSQKSRKESPY